MATQVKDTEALLQHDEDQPSDHGTFRPLRTLALAGSVLGVASVAVPQLMGRSSPTLAAPLTGLIEKDEVDTFPLGVFIDPHTDVKECWEVASDGAVKIKECDKDSDKQKFTTDGSRIMWDKKCLKAPGLFKKCPEKNDTNFDFTLWKTGSFGKITNCCGEEEKDCNCEDAEQLKVSSKKLVLSDPGTDFTTVLKWKDMDTGPFPCTANGENCMKSKCCSEAGMTCFEKNKHWASCNETCSKKMMWDFDDGKWAEQDEDIWSCKALSDPPGCSKNGDNCTASKCCSDPDSQCFKKNDHWSSCNKTCDHNMLWKDDKWQKQDEKVWECDVLSCTANGDNCMSSKCCSEPGMTCFKKNSEWASCNQTCEHNMLWTDGGWEKQDEKVWDCAALSCTPNGQNCMDSKCCSEPGMTCFKKNAHWASCNKTCSHDMLWTNNGWEKQDEKVWDCEVMSCTPNGENCMSTKCCSEPGMTCFKKNSEWASCNKTCSHNMLWVGDRWEEQDEKYWDCAKLTAD